MINRDRGPPWPLQWMRLMGPPSYDTLPEHMSSTPFFPYFISEAAPYVAIRAYYDEFLARLGPWGMWPWHEIVHACQTLACVSSV